MWLTQPTITCQSFHTHRCRDDSLGMTLPLRNSIRCAFLSRWQFLVMILQGWWDLANHPAALFWASCLPPSLSCMFSASPITIINFPLCWTLCAFNLPYLCYSCLMRLHINFTLLSGTVKIQAGFTVLGTESQIPTRVNLLKGNKQLLLHLKMIRNQGYRR